MKKRNLFLTLTFIALAVLVGLGSMCATFAQAQGVALQVAAASESTKLFNDQGNYAVERNTLNNSKGKVFNFFGYDWYLVNINNEAEVATFWMVNPYGSDQSYRYVFNKPTQSATTDTDLFWEGKTLWGNGYTDTIWNNDVHLGNSNLKNEMHQIAAQIIDNNSYKNYKNKVVAGYVAGSNMENQEQNAKMSISHVYHAEQGTTTLYEVTSPAQTMVADYTLGADDRLWLPSTEEVRDSGYWKLNNTQRNYQIRTVDNVCWLRTPVDNDSSMAQLIGCAPTITDAGVTATQAQSFFKTNVDQAHGVRPAIHLSLKDYGDGNGSKGGWFTDDMMKVFFIIICVLGIIGVILVIIAVVAKARRDKAEGQAGNQAN